jgi:hypothetical protein
LSCELVDTRGHMLAALGRLHMHLEHFSERRYRQTFLSCWTAIDNAIGRDGP